MLPTAMTLSMAILRIFALATLSFGADEPLSISRRQLLKGTGAIALTRTVGLPEPVVALVDAPKFVPATRVDLWMASRILRRLVNYEFWLLPDPNLLSESLRKVATELSRLENVLAVEFKVKPEVVRENISTMLHNDPTYIPRRYPWLGESFEKKVIESLRSVDRLFADVVEYHLRVDRESGYGIPSPVTVSPLELRKSYWMRSEWMNASMYWELKKVDPEAAREGYRLATRAGIFKTLFESAKSEKEWTIPMRNYLLTNISLDIRKQLKVGPSSAIAAMELELANEWKIPLDQLVEWVEGWRFKYRDLKWHLSYRPREYPKPYDKYRLEYLQRLDAILPQLADLFRLEPNRQYRYEVDWPFLTKELKEELRRDAELHGDSVIVKQIDEDRRSIVHVEKKQDSTDEEQQAVEAPGIEEVSEIGMNNRAPRILLDGMRQTSVRLVRKLKGAVIESLTAAGPSNETTANCHSALLLSPPRESAEKPLAMPILETEEPLPMHQLKRFGRIGSLTSLGAR